MSIERALKFEAQNYTTNPEEALSSVRRLMSQHDTVELSGEQRVIIADRLGSEVVEMVRLDGKVNISARKEVSQKEQRRLDISI